MLCLHRSSCIELFMLFNVNMSRVRPTKRKCPTCASALVPGSTKRGLDGQMWASKMLSNGAYRWQRAPSKAKPQPSKARRAATKRPSKARRVANGLPSKAKGKTCEQDVDTLITKKCKNKGLFSCQPRRLRNKLVESCKTCRADPEQCAKHANDLKQKREIREGMSKMQNHRDRVYQAMTL